MLLLRCDFPVRPVGDCRPETSSAVATYAVESHSQVVWGFVWKVGKT
jgi:hypothetical protein